MRLLTCALLVLPAVSLAAEPTYAERLGWPEGARVVIFHNDDAGMSHSSNAGTIEGFEEGLLSSVSTMMPCGWVPEWAAWLRENPDIDNGIHLTLTAEWDNYRWMPVAGAAQVPGLVDKDGYLHDNVAQVVENATPDEVETEIRAQIAKAEAMGMTITHIDSHMGTLFATPEFFERYMKVGIEKQLPILVAGGHLTHARRENPEAVEQLMPIAGRVWEAGLPVLDDIHTDSYAWKELGTKKAEFMRALRDLEPGITLFIFHATRPSDVFDDISSSGEARLADLEVLKDAEVKALLEEEGIERTTWRELMQRRRAAGHAEGAAAR
jgi:hypothetical protein